MGFIHHIRPLVRAWPAVVLPALGPAAGCRGDAGFGGTPAAETWCATDAEAGARRCTDKGQVEWCHAEEGMAPHPHYGMDCAAYACLVGGYEAGNAEE